MTIPHDESLARLLDAAGRHQSEVLDGWQRTRVRFSQAPPLAELETLAQLPNIVIDVELGDDAQPVRFASSPPSATERDVVSALADLPAEVTAASTAESGIELVHGVEDWVRAAVVDYRKQGWVRTPHGLRRSVDANWAEVAASLADLSSVQVGDREIELTRVDASGRLPVAWFEPSDEDDEVLHGLRQVSDCAAWANVVVEMRRTVNEVFVALHPDQAADVPVMPGSAEGGVALFEWLNATPDANRGEALRHVLRTASLSLPHSLPSAAAVRSLAEQHRIALSRDNAAAVQRAISESHNEASRALHEGADGIADAVSSSVKSTNAAIVAVLGVVALTARSAAALPAWLILTVAVIAVTGLWVGGMTVSRRLKDYSFSLARTRSRIELDPLTPDEEKSRATETLDGLGVAARARLARWQIFLPTVAASLVVLAAAWWLAFHFDPVLPDESPPASVEDLPASSDG